MTEGALWTLIRQNSKAPLDRQRVVRIRKASLQNIEAAELLELLFAHVADAIFVAKPDGRIIDVNPAASRNDRLTFLSNPGGKENVRSLHFSLPLAAAAKDERADLCSAESPTERSDFIGYSRDKRPGGL